MSINLILKSIIITGNINSYKIVKFVLLLNSCHKILVDGVSAKLYMKSDTILEIFRTDFRTTNHLIHNSGWCLS